MHWGALKSVARAFWPAIGVSCKCYLASIPATKKFILMFDVEPCTPYLKTKVIVCFLYPGKKIGGRYMKILFRLVYRPAAPFLYFVGINCFVQRQPGSLSFFAPGISPTATFLSKSERWPGLPDNGFSITDLPAIWRKRRLIIVAALKSLRSTFCRQFLEEQLGGFINSPHPYHIKPPPFAKPKQNRDWRFVPLMQHDPQGAEPSSVGFPLPNKECPCSSLTVNLLAGTHAMEWFNPHRHFTTLSGTVKLRNSKVYRPSG